MNDSTKVSKTPKKPKKTDYIHSVGKRKTAIARVWLQPKGSGLFTINRKPLDQYITRSTSKMIIKQPFVITEQDSSSYDVLINVKGGGLSAQAEAIRHGISRALSIFDHELRSPLKKGGLITRDARKKERKLPGQPGARKRFQFSKR